MVNALMVNLKAPRVGCEESRNRHYDRADMRRQSRTYVGWVDLGTAAVLATVPLLYRFGELVPSLTYITVVYLG
jgi:hypothetical protein